jgi:hypothetical protein
MRGGGKSPVSALRISSCLVFRFDLRADGLRFDFGIVFASKCAKFVTKLKECLTILNADGLS